MGRVCGGSGDGSKGPDIDQYYSERDEFTDRYEEIGNFWNGMAPQEGAVTLCHHYLVKRSCNPSFDGKYPERSCKCPASHIFIPWYLIKLYAQEYNRELRCSKRDCLQHWEWVSGEDPTGSNV